MPQERGFTIEEDLTLALRLADLADEITLKRYQALDLIVETKPDATPVTDADMAVERAIREVLAAERPDDLIVGEEFGGADLSANLEASMHGIGKHYWVIDPIDGTKNFLRGIPTWATLIGLSNPANTVIVGVVSAPSLFRRWYAANGKGAFVTIRNLADSTKPAATSSSTKQIHVSKVSQISDAQLAYSDLIGWGPLKENFLMIQERVWRTRGFGDFWSHMLVAEGSVDLAIEPSLSLWDMAALEIIVKEAGGEFTNTAGQPGSHGGSLVTSNGHLHHRFIEALNG
jgi:histidinol-phosphatase